MRHADGVAGVCERELEKRVGDDGRGVAEHKQGVVSKHGPQAEQGRDHQGLLGQAREGRVTMDNLNILRKKNMSEVKEGSRRWLAGWTVCRKGKELYLNDYFAHIYNLQPYTLHLIATKYERISNIRRKY